MVKNVSKSVLAGALPQTPLGELTAPPRPLADGEGARCLSLRTHPTLAFWASLHLTSPPPWK